MRELQPSRRAETVVIALLLGAAACALAFVVLYAVDANTQLLGLSLGLSTALLAAAAIVAGKRVVVQETAVEERPELVRPEEETEVESHGLALRKPQHERPEP